MGLFIVAIIVILVVAIVIVARRQSGRPAVPGSGRVVTKQRPLDGFARVNVGNAFHVELKQAPQFSVSISADDNVIDLVEAEKEGDTLRIGLQAEDYSQVTLWARITMPELQGVMLTGASRASLEGFSSANELNVSLNGASVLNGYVEARTADLRIDGASKVTLAGSADALALRASGASVLDLEHFSADRASATLNGASQAALNVRAAIEDADLSGASVLTYSGDPEVGDIRTSGASRFERRESEEIPTPRARPASCSTEAEQTAGYGGWQGAWASTLEPTRRLLGSSSWCSCWPPGSPPCYTCSWP